MQTDYFHYKKSRQAGYLSCRFHSLLELKFVLSIEDSWCFLREHISIYYDPTTFLPTSYIRETTKKYTPDFLIRNKEDNRAYLIELKPREFQNARQINIRTRVADNYIRIQKADWIYKVIYDDEIILSNAKHQKFMLLRANTRAFNFRRHMENLDKKFNISKINYFKTIPDHKEKGMNPADYAKFVKYGFSLPKTG